MDRNLSMGLDGRFKLWSLSARRAWIEISSVYLGYMKRKRSLSARRAWIEMLLRSAYYSPSPSLSARRAWIEMPWLLSSVSDSLPVALRKESVDRNSDGVVSGSADYGRSPQGERG